MRISPLGIFGANCDLQQVAAWAQQDAALTHPQSPQASARFCDRDSPRLSSGIGMGQCRILLRPRGHLL